MSWPHLLLLLSTQPALAGPEMIPPEAMQAAATQVTELELPLLDGGQFRLSEHRGRPVVLAFWASWCSPCRHELPDLSQLARAHPQVSWLTVNVDRSAASAQAFLARFPTDLPVALDPEARSMSLLSVSSMPTLILLDRQGRVALRKAGYSRTKGFAELEAALGDLP